MKIQYLNGGLANQVFQYMFYRCGELSFPQYGPWLLDDSFFFINQVHNGYELEKVFGLKPNLLSQYFDKDVWAYMIEQKKSGISIPQSIKNMGFPIKMIAEFNNYKEHNPFDGEVIQVPGNTYIPELHNLKDTFYYHGYWLHDAWFQHYCDLTGQELHFPPITNEQNLNYANKIAQEKSVAIHIRRGDYVKIGWASAPGFFKENIEKLLGLYPDAAFFVFSDDITWCKQNALELGLTLTKQIVYVEGNTHGNNYIDLQLMSMCPIMLIGRSAFSSLARLLNPSVELVIYDNPNSTDKYNPSH